MIELPRAALTADQIAEEAEFFSFGTNDLTQMTFGFSRDDITSFMPTYLEDKILQVDPFQTLDVDGVGQLVEMGVAKGRAARKAKTASTSRSASAASTAATRTASRSATRWAWTTSRAPRSACRSPGSPPPRPPSPAARRSAATVESGWSARRERAAGASTARPHPWLGHTPRLPIPGGERGRCRSGIPLAALILGATCRHARP